MNLERLKQEGICWGIKRHECPECLREGVELFVKGENVNITIAYFNNTQDAIGVINALKKAGVMNDTGNVTED